MTEPSVGLRAGLVDVAVTRAPFDGAGLSVRVLWSEPVAAMLRSDDPLAARASLRLEDLADRRRFRFPDTTDPLWSDFWTGGRQDDDAPVVRVPRDCQRAVLWNGAVGIFPLHGDLAPGLTAVEIIDHPPSEVVVAWRRSTSEPLVHTFVSLITVMHSSPGCAESCRPR